MPHKGASTQHHNQQVLAKPCHQPSDRDQQASRAYIQLGEEALQIVHKTFAPDILVVLHLLALADNTIDTNTPPHCMLYKKASIVCQLLTTSLQVLNRHQ